MHTNFPTWHHILRLDLFVRRRLLRVQLLHRCALLTASAQLSAVVVAAAASSPSLPPPRPSLPPPSSPPLLLQPRHTVKRPIKRALAVVNSNAAAGLGCAVRARLTQPRLAAAAVAAELVSILCVITPRSGDVAVTWRMRSSIMATE